MWSNQKFAPVGVALVVLEQVNKLGNDASSLRVWQTLNQGLRQHSKTRIYETMRRLRWNGLIEIVSVTHGGWRKMKIYSVTQAGRDVLSRHPLYDGFTRKTDMWRP